ncbi:MAG: AAA family ATPase [Pyrinomonadaceae bacterium]
MSDNNTIDRALPSSPDTESVVLGAILVENSLIGAAAEKLQPSDFYPEGFRREVFRVMLRLVDAGKPINAHSIDDELKQLAVGAVFTVVDISNLTVGLPHFSDADFDSYTGILKEKSLERDVIRYSDYLMTNFAETENKADFLRLASERLKELSEATNGNRSNLRLVKMSDVEAEEIFWLWFPFMAIGKLTLVSGEEGLGKSWLSCALASAVSTGSGFPANFEKQDAGNVLMLSAEDGLADTIKPRLEAVGANCERVFVIDEPLSFDEKGLLKLESYIAEAKPKLVTVDPLFAYTPSKTDINSANQSRSISARLAEIATKWSCSIMLVRHIGKAKGFGDARAAGLGSIDWRAAVRSELLVGRNPDNEKERAIVQTKNNLAEFGEAVGFTIENSSDGAKFLWTGKSNLTASMILANVKDDDARAEQSDAVEFLKEVLSDGEKYSKDIYSEARQNGISERTLKRAKTALNVESRKEGFNPTKWFWKLPEECHEEPEECHENRVGTLRVNYANKAS